MFFSTNLDIPIFLFFFSLYYYYFFDDDLRHKYLWNHILLTFKNYLYQVRENRIFNVNMHENYRKIRKISDPEPETNLKDNDKYNRKWTVISNII